MVTSNTKHFLELLEMSKNNKLNKFYISELIQNNQSTFDNIFKILTEKDKQLLLSQKDLERLKNWTTFLKNKNMIHPHLNGGQSAGSLFIRKYCSNLINQKNDNLLHMKIFIFEEICKFLFEIKLLQVLLFITRKASNFFRKNKFLNKYLLIKRFIKYRYDKNNAYSVLQESSNRWSNNKLSIDQIIERVDEKVNIYDDMISQNDLAKLNKVSYISFPSKKFKKNNKLKSIQNIFENSYLSFPKSIPFKIKYKIFDKDD